MLEYFVADFWAHLWAYSALMNLVLSLTCVVLAVRLTYGAGFHCPMAFVRYLQRIALMLLALALLNCALHTIHVREAPPSWAILTQIAFMLVVGTSAARHIMAPPIPPEASWRRPIHNLSYVERLMKSGESR